MRTPAYGSISKRRKRTKRKIPHRVCKNNWSSVTIRSILTNEKYKGDAIINKTFVVDCISKQVKINNGERKKYYVKNNHPAIIDDATFAKVQAELTYNDEVVRKLIECVVIESKNQIKVVFRDGTQMEQTLQDENIHWLTNFMLQ